MFVSTHPKQPLKFLVVFVVLAVMLSFLAVRAIRDLGKLHIPQKAPVIATDIPEVLSANTGDSTSVCHTVRGVLPDPVCTPGVRSPTVTQDNIHQTICVSGYSKSVRPPAGVTDALKKVSMKQYGFGDSPSRYEYDHLISLSLGGAPLDTKNLWAEPSASPNPKDAVEIQLHKLVCQDKLPLLEAQNRLAADWTTALQGL